VFKTFFINSLNKHFYITCILLYINNKQSRHSNKITSLNLMLAYTLVYKDLKLILLILLKANLLARKELITKTKLTRT
jgi:hypothetical protein